MDTCDNQDESPENYAQWGGEKKPASKHYQLYESI